MYNQLPPQYSIPSTPNFYDFNVFSFIMMTDQRFGYTGLTNNQKAAMFMLWGEYLSTPNGLAAQAQPQSLSQLFYNYLLSNQSRLIELSSKPLQPISMPFPAQQMGYIPGPPPQQFQQLTGQFQNPAMYPMQIPSNSLFPQPQPQPLSQQQQQQQFGSPIPNFSPQPQTQQQIFSEHNTDNLAMEREWLLSMSHMVSLFESRKGKLDPDEVYAVITTATRTNCVTQNNTSLYSNVYVGRVDSHFKIIGLFVINQPFDHSKFGWKRVIYHYHFNHVYLLSINYIYILYLLIINI